ncbi:type IV pilus modification protein PilV [Ramlibacter sp. USB13]|uniref:Type IV pilus modification protein PilV n=1 Tax=Ramlibacter cellulosilyticus TaxID=2764187 RepID=A0A923SCL1_9BURK|nr:type IV pilus modification protein PilV [Ramlibacter cellulosilyticus]MBC5785004.1 type IV pilus modification protein PilV [Ramlibacter cellulosilyticus]
MNLRRPVRQPARRSTLRGASLIEVLVAILIASLGLLAFAGLTASSVRYTKMSQYRATATQLAQDIAERARANIVDGNVTAYEFLGSFSSQATAPTLPAKTCQAAADTCSVAEIAAMDLYEWQQAARKLLPEGSVFLQRDAAVLGAFDLWLAWRDPTLATGESKEVAKECPNDLGVDSEDGVRCMYFRVKL